MLVSVIMPAYNVSRYVEQAIESLSRELGEVRLDIIVVDDGSTDGTADVTRQIARRRPEVRLIPGSHGGISAARNRGLSALPDETQFVTFHDADDIAYPGRIARQCARLLADPDAQAVYGLLQLFDLLDDKALLPAPEARTATLRGISLSAGLYRREIIDRIGRFDESLSLSEDTDFLFRMVESGATIHMEDEVATFYRRHDSNTTRDFRVARCEFMKAIHKSVRRRRLAGGAGVAPLASGMFAERRQLEEIFQPCSSNTPS
ncbi:MAG: glycosyltransferase family A protein [Planctomycetia bacterium]|nr:glycosyltransferase family A protein [Planctomycetia bacterium]